MPPESGLAEEGRVEAGTPSSATPPLPRAVAVADDGGAPGVGVGDTCWAGCGSAVAQGAQEEAGAEATPDGVLETDVLGGDVGALTDVLVVLAGALGGLAGAITAADGTARFAV